MKTKKSAMPGPGVYEFIDVSNLQVDSSEDAIKTDDKFT